eukprot:Skav232767  [mRNA]  locus=scaffold1229:242985:248589:- [translate_table: standard]
MPIDVGQVVFHDYGERPRVVHSRLVLAEVDRSTFEYAIATPDGDVYIEVCDGSNGDLRHFYTGGPGGGLPRGVPANCIYGFAPMTAMEYSQLMREGAAVALAERTARGMVGVPPVLGAVGGAGPPAAAAAAPAVVPAMGAVPGQAVEVWVLGECCGDRRIGEQVVPPVGLPTLGDFGLMSLVDRDGNSRAVLIKKMPVDQIASFCDERIQLARDATAVEGEERSSSDDIRTLSIKYTANGERRRVFKETIGELTQTEMEDFPYEPRTCLPYLQAIVNMSESAYGQHLQWIQQAKIPEGSRAIYEDETLAHILDVAVCYDGLAVCNLASFELLVRRRQLLAEAHSYSPSAPCFEGADYWMGTKFKAGGGIVIPSLIEHVARKLHADAQILKERRKLEENKGKAKGKPSKGAYDDSADVGVGSVVNMDLSRLSLPSGGVAGVSLVDSLEGSTRNMVEDFENYMFQDADAWTYLEDEAAKVPPYNDQLLATRKGYLAFLRRLFDAGVLGYTSTCRGRVGAFTVAKKSKVVEGVEQKRQRLVLDCRQTNLQFREPPMTELGSLASLGNISLPKDKNLYVASADIRDCFYAVNCPNGMSDFFCLKSDLSPSEAQFVSNGTWNVSDDLPRISPCVTVLPMGFSWSFYLIQVLHEQATMRALHIPRTSLILDGQPPPVVDDSSCVAMPYCDNVHTISLDPHVCQAGCNVVQDELKGLGFELHEETEASTQCNTLGGVIDGELGQVRASNQRMWRISLGFQYLTYAKVHPVLVQKLLGHAMTLCVLNRAGMSVFRRLYDFVEQGGDARYLTVLEREECWNFIGIIPLLFADLRKPWSDTVIASDASPDGFGMCESTLDLKEVESIGQWNERWRFRRLPASEWAPRKRALGRNVFGDVRTVVGNANNWDECQQYSHNDAFPEVPAYHLSPHKWKTVGLGKWANTHEHITLKEGRALVLALRRLSRTRRHRGRKHLIFLDNIALCFAVRKGRAHTYDMLRVMQQLPRVIASAPKKDCRTLRASPKIQVESKVKGPKSSKRMISSKSIPLPANKRVRRTVQAVVMQEEPEDKLIGKLAQLRKVTKLEGKSISKESRAQYALYLQRFRDFCLGSGVQWPMPVMDADLLMADFMDVMFQDGRSAHEGEKTLAALEFEFIELKGQMARSRRALRGWRKVMPATSRLPLPKMMMHGIAMQLLSQGKRDMALMTLVMFSLYLRPGEALDLCKRHVVAPVKMAGNQGLDVRSPGLQHGQGAGQVADRSKCPAIQQGGKSAATAQSAQPFQSKILPVERKEHGEGLPRIDPSTIVDRLNQVDILTLQHRPHRFGIELFAGSGRLAAAITATGLPTFPIDICLFPSHNVLDLHVEKKLISWIQQGRILFIWAGMPCATFSRARKHDNLGPGPLRTDEFLWGLPGLGFADRKKVHEGNLLLAFLLRVLHACQQYSIPYMVENPASSMLWNMSTVTRFCCQYSPYYLTLDYCAYGEHWKKPTSILFNFIHLHPLAKRCAGHHNKCQFTHKPHIALQGRDKNGTFLTLVAQPYPWMLVRDIAALVSSRCG